MAGEHHEEVVREKKYVYDPAKQLWEHLEEQVPHEEICEYIARIPQDNLRDVARYVLEHAPEEYIPTHRKTTMLGAMEAIPEEHLKEVMCAAIKAAPEHVRKDFAQKSRLNVVKIPKECIAEGVQLG